MLVLVDVLAEDVLLLVDLLLLVVGQIAAVGLAVVAHFLVQAGFFSLKVSGFARRQLAGLDSVGDALLLVLVVSIQSMRYSRDEEKNRANAAKHGIAFEDAIGVFDGPMVREDAA